jgi:hypothetical protein
MNPGFQAWQDILEVLIASITLLKGSSLSVGSSVPGTTEEW